MSDVLPSLREEKKKNPSAGFANDSGRIRVWREKKEKKVHVSERASERALLRKEEGRARARALLLQDSRRCLLSAACRAKAALEEEEEEEGSGGGGTWELVQRYCSHGDLRRGLLPRLPPHPSSPLPPNREGGHGAAVVQTGPTRRRSSRGFRRRKTNSRPAP